MAINFTNSSLFFRITSPLRGLKRKVISFICQFIDNFRITSPLRGLKPELNDFSECGSPLELLPHYGD